MLKAIWAVKREPQHCFLGTLPLFPPPPYQPQKPTPPNYLKFELEHRNMIVLCDLLRAPITNFTAKEITFKLLLISYSEIAIVHPVTNPASEYTIYNIAWENC